ncbi:MAG: MBOAT family protein [Paludibacteraceae bacterium]|nr:MBOAT family protein [Paludibacteraceae bacterium]
MQDLLYHIFAFDPHSPLLFTQFYFWAFFALVYAVFSLVHSKRLLRNAFLFFVSLFFYYKTSGLAILILLFVTCSDFLIAKRIDSAQTQGRRKAWLTLSVVLDLGLLAFFKYAYFFTNLVNDLFSTDFHVFNIFAFVGNGFSTNGIFNADNIVLPVGISFYIFQVISYTADVYYKRIKPVSNPLDFGFYVSFFPQLVAGPIVRASEFIPQLYKPFHLGRRQFGIAVFWILNGLAKKLILSDYLAVNFIDRVFDNPLLFSGFENLMALFLYSLQVYADFSGYTDIAIGVAMLMGFYLPQNFNSPYKAPNAQNFWKLWHISLSKWLQTYLYIPLGGNRNTSFGTYFWIITISLVAMILSGSWVVTAILLTLAVIVLVVAWRVPDHRRKLYANLNSLITMLLGGLWHGASWNFMIWGGLNGIGMIVYKFWKDMSWHLRMALLLVVTGGLIAWRHWQPLPVVNLFIAWMLLIDFGSLIRYIYFLFTKTKEQKKFEWIANAWAVIQTFIFITFTRLFFRSGSNLDPATANHEAWQTAQDMVRQIGSAWNLSVIPDICIAYYKVFLLFVLGMIIHWLPVNLKRRYRLCFAMQPVWVMAVEVVLTVFVLYQFVTSDLQAFIYFQF